MFLRLAPRAATEPARVAELVGLCGYLPLAISLLASLFSKHRSWTMDHLISETKTSLLTVTAENRTVAAAFDLSYRYLPTDRQRFFRRLGLQPGVDLDAYAAAALADITPDQASEHLDALYSDRLLDEPVYRRYRMHDLICDYAHTLAATDPADERDQAVGRLLDYYQHTATLADTFLTRHTRPVAATPAALPGAVPKMASRDQALAWLRTERANLLACLDHTTHHARVVGLTAGLASLLRSDGPWTQALQLHATAVTAARHLGDRLGEANTLHDLGFARYLTDDYPGTAQVLEQALSLYCDLSNRLGEANALNDLGLMRLVTGDYPGAAQLLKQALSFFRALGDRSGEAEVLNRSGTLHRKLGDLEQALAHHQRALELARAIGIPLEEARALDGAGRCALDRGDTASAVTGLRQALEIYQRIGAAEVSQLATDLADLDAE
jgi:tetratricopeptide (TPR) repeat protein